MTPAELVERLGAVAAEAAGGGHCAADVGDALLGCALAHYKAAGYSPAEARQLLLDRLRYCVSGGVWKVIQ